MADRDLASWREEYAERGLDVSDLPPNPVGAVVDWLDASRAAGLYEPNAMVVSTVDADGRPSSRMVLLKSVDANGFTFFTNYRSRKAAALDANPRCALVFGWHALQRQVRVEGRAERISSAESNAYFATRPRDSQIGAWASPQSSVVDDRDELERAYEEVVTRFSGGEVPRPPHWGGYRVVPDVIEFWQGRYGRMHDRVRFRRAGEQAGDGDQGWHVDRLAP